MRLMLALLIVGLGGPSSAHDNWISSGSHKNSAGEWCCGTNDCKVYEHVTTAAKGWNLGDEFVPYDEALPVAPPDGHVTVCRRADGSRRCVFGVRPGL